MEAFTPSEEIHTYFELIGVTKRTRMELEAQMLTLKLLAFSTQLSDYAELNSVIEEVKSKDESIKTYLKQHLPASIGDLYPETEEILDVGKKKPTLKKLESFLSFINTRVIFLEKLIERINAANVLVPYVRYSERNSNIFIIHGHDDGRLYELKEMLKSEFALNPIILKEQPDGGAKTIIEKFERYARQCSFAIALFTPDEL